MDKIKVDLAERSYKILIKPGLLDNSSSAFSKYVKGKKCFIVSDDNVFSLYGVKIKSALKEALCTSVKSFAFKPGEPSKNIETLNDIYNKMALYGMNRKSIVIALGGGVPGDIAGFAAATYMRGIDYIQVPTSLLAMVDSSVGGKTGIDLPHGKNLVGAFWQPKLVVIDPSTLNTLPKRELLSGLAEIIKYGIIQDYELFIHISKSIEKILNLDLQLYCSIIARCCWLKAEVVKKDEQESNIRAILNYGHTFGHAIEAVTKYKKYTHGEAIAIGMNMAAKTAKSLKFIDDETLNQLEGLSRDLGLPVKAEGVEVEEIYNAMFKDKKASDGKIKYVIPTKIGRVELINGIDEKIIKESIDAYVCNNSEPEVTEESELDFDLNLP
jgi:3-dehydroquinate synthase